MSMHGVRIGSVYHAFLDADGAVTAEFVHPSGADEHARYRKRHGLPSEVEQIELVRSADLSRLREIERAAMELVNTVDWPIVEYRRPQFIALRAALNAKEPT